MSETDKVSTGYERVGIIIVHIDSFPDIAAYVLCKKQDDRAKVFNSCCMLMNICPCG